MIVPQMRSRLAMAIGVLPGVAVVASGPLHMPRKIAHVTPRDATRLGAAQGRKDKQRKPAKEGRTASHGGCMAQMVDKFKVCLWPAVCIRDTERRFGRVVICRRARYEPAGCLLKNRLRAASSSGRR
jgi:hypothetical protein